MLFLLFILALFPAFSFAEMTKIVIEKRASPSPAVTNSASRAPTRKSLAKLMAKSLRKSTKIRAS